MKRIFVVSFAALVLAAGVPDAGATIFDFTTGSPDSGGFGNTFTRTDLVDGITVVVTGWSATSGPFSASQVRRFSTGLGTCASNEGLNCPGGPHTVDNDGMDEVFYITFSEPVLLDEATITAWDEDYDASFWAGTGSLAMGSIGFADLGTRTDSNFDANNAEAGVSFRVVDLHGLEDPVDWLVFGVRPGQSNDKFKFKSLALHLPVRTPEPGLLLLLGVGAALLSTRRR